MCIGITTISGPRTHSGRFHECARNRETGDERATHALGLSVKLIFRTAAFSAAVFAVVPRGAQLHAAAATNKAEVVAGAHLLGAARESAVQVPSLFLFEAASVPTTNAPSNLVVEIRPTRDFEGKPTVIPQHSGAGPPLTPAGSFSELTVIGAWACLAPCRAGCASSIRGRCATS